MAETLRHIVFLSRADRLIHEEQHLSSLEGYDFGQLIKNSETEEKRLGSKSDIVVLLLTEGDRWCRWVEGLPDAWLSEQVRRPAVARKAGLKCSWGPTSTKCIIGDS